MENKRGLPLTFFLLSFLFVARSDDEYKCVYTIYAKTGSNFRAGTDSKITLELWNKIGDGVRISDIEKWGGLMGQYHDYFERGNLDIFSGTGPCLSEPVCAMKLISDGSGSLAGWYCNYIEVTTTGPRQSCAQKKFEVQQWLTDSDPYELNAVRDYCPYDLNKSPSTNLRAISSS